MYMTLFYIIYKYCKLEYKNPFFLNFVSIKILKKIILAYIAMISPNSCLHINSLLAISINHLTHKT